MLSPLINGLLISLIYEGGIISLGRQIDLKAQYVSVYTVYFTFKSPACVIRKRAAFVLIPNSFVSLKGELQRENKLISYERAFQMLENDTYITVIGQAVLELLSFKVGSGNHQTGISFLQKFSEI